MFQFLHTFLLLLLRLWNAIHRLAGRARRAVAASPFASDVIDAFRDIAAGYRLPDRPPEAWPAISCAHGHWWDLNPNVAWWKFQVPLQTAVVSVAIPHRTHLQRQTLI